MNPDGETQPTDLSPGVYRDSDGDLWLVDRNGVAVVLTDRYGNAYLDEPIIIPPEDLGRGIRADEAHATYHLRLLRAF